MQTFLRIIGLLFGPDGELRGIIATTLTLSVFSTSLSSVIGICLGSFLGCSAFRGKRLIMRVLHTLMSMPSVVAGLIVFLLLSRKGPLGQFGLLFSMPAMVIAQVFLITPVMIGFSATTVAARAQPILETTRGLRLGKGAEIRLILRECRLQLLSVILMGFGRAISEVGAVSLVGGNVKYRTRVMTTTIMLETSMGNFDFSIALGILLLLISLLINSLAQYLQERGEKHLRNN
ncbi:MAG: ABC transporter permease [Clostridia bacterium]|nr:ABC transporter permease [Clostridia bacterium]